MIEASSACCITCSFTDFDLADNIDYVRLIDPTTTPATTLATYTAANPPTTYTHHGEALLVMFKTNATLTGDGWKASYTSSMQGIEEEYAQSMLLYPNPCRDRIFIEGAGGEYQLTDPLGKVLRRGSC